MDPFLGPLHPEMETSDHQWPWPHLYLSCPPKTEGEKDRCQESHRVQVRWKWGMGIWETKVRRVKRAKRIETKASAVCPNNHTSNKFVQYSHFLTFPLADTEDASNITQKCKCQNEFPLQVAPFTHTHISANLQT